MGMGKKALCCTDNLLVLMVCGVFVSLMGLVLLIIYLVARGITSSLHLVEPPIPTYVAALLTITLGVISVILTKKRHLILICTSILLSVLDLIVCIVHAVTAGLVSIPFLGSFSVCILRATSAECQCYILGEGNATSSVIVPGDNTKHFTFEDAKSCNSIETSLKDFLYTLCILYSFTSLGCLVTGALSSMLLCGNRQPVKAQRDQEGLVNPSRRTGQSNHSDDENHERNLSSLRRTETATSPRVSSIQGREATMQATPQGRRQNEGTMQATTQQARRPTEASTQVTPQGRRPMGSDVTNSENRPVRRSASVTSPPSSATATPSGGSARPATRYNSVGGRGSESARQRPSLPLLVRSGYLQIHVNGPRVPVFSVQGSNESYIALTDLPKLQLPALDQVPAYVREPELPSYEPPPYSPAADTLSESPELAAEASRDRSPHARQCLSFSNENTSVAGGNHLEQPSLVLPEPHETNQQTLVTEELATTHTAVAFPDEQQEDQFGNGQTETLGTGDIIVHERDVSDHVNDIDSEPATADVAAPAVNDLSMDLQPPDILMEAIESARSSMNVTAHMIEDGANVEEQSCDIRNQQRHDPPSSSQQENIVLPSNTLEVFRDQSSHDATSSLSSREPTERSRNASADRGRRRDTNRSGGSPSRGTRDKHKNSPSRTEGRRIPPMEDHRNVPRGHRTKSMSPNRESAVQRSKSLSSSADRDRDRDGMLQKRPSMPKQGRRAESIERERKASHTKRTSRSPHVSLERKLEAESKQKRKNKARNQGAPSSPSRGTSSSENLSDIISLVERVHNTPTEQSLKKKKRKRTTIKDGMLDSKV